MARITFTIEDVETGGGFDVGVQVEDSRLSHPKELKNYTVDDMTAAIGFAQNMEIYLCQALAIFNADKEQLEQFKKDLGDYITI